MANPNDIYVCVRAGDIYKRFNGTGNFIALGQASRQWRSLASAPNGDVYACTEGTDPDAGDRTIYKQTDGTGDFISLGQAYGMWQGIAVAPNGDVYASISGGDIYIQVGGVGNFVATGQTIRSWTGMASSPNGDVFACEFGGDIYKLSGGVFVGLGQTPRSWRYMTVASNGDVYACANGDDIYKQTGGVGNFIGLGQGSLEWNGLAAAPNGDVYASVISGDIYLQAGGIGNFIAMGQGSLQWLGMAGRNLAQYPPVASFTYTVDPTTASAQFEDTSTFFPTSWEWDFGDFSSPSFDENPFHTFPAAGVYIVSLTASNSNGSSTIVELVFIHESFVTTTTVAPTTTTTTPAPTTTTTTPAPVLNTSEVFIRDGFLNFVYDGMHAISATSSFTFHNEGFEIGAELRQAFDPVYFSIYNDQNTATFKLFNGDYTCSLATGDQTYNCWGHLNVESPIENQYFTDYVCISSEDVENKYVPLTYLFDSTTEVAVNVVGGTSQKLDADFYISDNKIKWDGRTLDGEINPGDILRVIYLAQGLSDPVRVKFILKDNILTVMGSITNGHYNKLMKRTLLSSSAGSWKVSFYMNTGDIFGRGYVSKFLAIADSFGNTGRAKPFTLKTWRQPMIVYKE